jgi:hypothetical protein
MFPSGYHDTRQQFYLKWFVPMVAIRALLHLTGLSQASSLIQAIPDLHQDLRQYPTSGL